MKEFQNFISIWSDSANDIPILLGTHCFRRDFPHNAIILLHNNKIMQIYFKQHKVPFAERTVILERILGYPILSFDWIADDEKKIMQNDLICISGKIYQIFICSEFFFEIKKVWGYPVLLLWNDNWLSCDYIKKMALIFIKYFENKYKVNVYHLATSGATNIN